MSSTDLAVVEPMEDILSDEQFERTQKWIARRREMGLATANWNPEVLAVIKTHCCPPTKGGQTIPADQLEVFMYQVQRYRLDPLAGEIFTVPRMTRVKVGHEQWEDGPTVWQPMVGRDGHRTLAERTGLLEYCETVVYPEPAEDATDVPFPVWARCRVKRRDRDREIVTTVYFREYNSGYSQWQSKPRTMIEKVAEAQALKKAFNINGVYTAAEFDLEDKLHETEQKYSTMPMPLKEIPEDESLPSRTSWKALFAKYESDRDEHTEKRLRVITEQYKDEQRELRERLKSNTAATADQRRMLEGLIRKRVAADDTYRDRAHLKAAFFAELLRLPDGVSDFTRAHATKAIQALGDDIQSLEDDDAEFEEAPAEIDPQPGPEPEHADPVEAAKEAYMAAPDDRIEGIKADFEEAGVPFDTREWDIPIAQKALMIVEADAARQVLGANNDETPDPESKP